VPKVKITFSAQQDQKLKPHIEAAFIENIILPPANCPQLLRVGGKVYTVIFDRLDPTAFADDEMVKTIISFQQHKGGKNYAVVRAYQPERPANYRGKETPNNSKDHGQ
jgi:hypothetical protein